MKDWWHKEAGVWPSRETSFRLESTIFTNATLNFHVLRSLSLRDWISPVRQGKTWRVIWISFLNIVQMLYWRDKRFSFDSYRLFLLRTFSIFIWAQVSVVFECRVLVLWVVFERRVVIAYHSYSRYGIWFRSLFDKDWVQDVAFDVPLCFHKRSLVSVLFWIHEWFWRACSVNLLDSPLLHFFAQLLKGHSLNISSWYERALRFRKISVLSCSSP